MLVRKYIYKKILILLPAFIAFIPFSISAIEESKFYFESSATSMSPGSEFYTTIYLKTEYPTNAIDLEVAYSRDTLEVASFDNSNSIINIWQASPRENAPGVIKLTGGMTQPFSGDKGKVVRINFKANDTGTPKITLNRSDVYLFDGKGTKKEALFTPISLSVEENSRVEVLPVSPKDTTPPQIFLEHTRAPDSRDRLVVFVANDEDSGISNSKIRFKKFFRYSSWQEAVNPIVLPEGVWKVELTSVNNQGLTTTKSLLISGELFGRASVIFVFILLVLSLRTLYNKRVFKS